MIRKAQKKDISDLVEIIKEVKVLQDYFGKQSSKMFNKMLKDKNSIFLVAEEDDKVIGFVNFEIEKEAQRIFLDTLAVDKNYRRGGIASKLFKEVEKYILRLHFKKLYFFVRDYNKEMNAFAKKKKFKLITKLNYWAKEY